jgi:hypothetical protein
MGNRERPFILRPNRTVTFPGGCPNGKNASENASQNASQNA